MSRELDASKAFLAQEITPTEYAARLHGVWPDVPTADLTPVQLNWALALRLGWEQAEIPAGDGYVSLSDPPAYSTDLNACATAEARIISMGLGEKYAEALEGEDWVTWDKNSDYENETDYAALARIATASAEARCRAMLATLEGK